MIKIETSNIDLVKAKFIDTIKTIEGYCKEAEGDLGMNVHYGPKAVYSRMNKIREAFARDIEKLAQDIKQIQ